MFHYLLRSDIPESEKRTARLNAEAVSFLGAGTYPTAATLIFVAYYIMADPKIENRLRNDLKDVMANFDEEVSQPAASSTAERDNLVSVSGKEKGR